VIEFYGVMWDVESDGILLGYVELTSGKYCPTAPDGSTHDGFSMLTDAGNWLLEKARGAKVEAPRRAGDRKGDIT
jgi:hypothetical protein